MNFPDLTGWSIVAGDVCNGQQYNLANYVCPYLGNIPGAHAESAAHNENSSVSLGNLDSLFCPLSTWHIYAYIGMQGTQADAQSCS